MTPALNRPMIVSASAVVAVADRSDGRLYARVGKPFGVTQRQVLRATVRMGDQPRITARSALVQGLFEGVEDEPGLSRP